jgi:hypothetical protein
MTIAPAKFVPDFPAPDRRRTAAAAETPSGPTRNDQDPGAGCQKYSRPHDAIRVILGPGLSSMEGHSLGASAPCWESAHLGRCTQIDTSTGMAIPGSRGRSTRRRSLGSSAARHSDLLDQHNAVRRTGAGVAISHDV